MRLGNRTPGGVLPQGLPEPTQPYVAEGHELLPGAGLDTRNPLVKLDLEGQLILFIIPRFWRFLGLAGCLKPDSDVAEYLDICRY